MVFKSRKGQGATEYIIVLAIVLIVALVVVALLGFFPGFSADTQVSQSSSYWQSTRPFAITASQQYTAGLTGQNVTLVITNNDPKQLVITSVNLTSIPGGYQAWNTTSFTFAPGDTQTVMVFNTTNMLLADCNTRSGKYNSYNVSFTYNMDQLTGKKQVGQKALSVSCT